MEDIKAITPNLQSEEIKIEPLKGGKIKKSRSLFLKANVWLAVSIVFLLLTVGLAFGLWGYQNNLAQEEQTLEEEIQSLNSQRDLELEEDFMALKSRMESLKIILNNRVYVSNVFKMIEELALSQVQFIGLQADLSQAELILTAEASNYATLAKQIFVFENDSRIKRAGLSGVGLAPNGKVHSDLTVELDYNFLHSK